MQPRSETYLLADGTGRIEVRGDYAASGLFLDGKPFVFNFADCAGSIGQDLYHFAPFVDGDKNRLAGLTEITTDLPLGGTCLSQLILPLLRQFPPGVYTLTIAPLAPGETWVEYYLEDYVLNWSYVESGYYPESDGVYGGKTLVATQPDGSLDDVRIAHYWYAIEDGARPFAITASTEGAMAEFVLDGHHKLQAYAYAKVKPWRLCISKASSPLAADEWPASDAAPRAWRLIHGH